MKRWRAWLLGALAVWIVVVAWWAAKPISDSVPTGIVKNVQTDQVVACHSVLSGNSAASEPIPELASDRAYERTPCELPYENGRVLLAIDGVVTLGLVVVLAKTWRPSTASQAQVQVDSVVSAGRD